MNWSLELVADVPIGVVTVTCTVPALPLGEGTTIWVDELLVKPPLATEFEPKLTDVAPLKFVPVMVTEVPPVAGPDVGEIPVTAGGDT